MEYRAINFFKYLYRFSELSTNQVALCLNIKFYNRRFFSKATVHNKPIDKESGVYHSAFERDLMDVPHVVQPNPFRFFKNLIFTNFIIPYKIDKTFNYKNFIYGSKKAIEVISYHLARNEISALEQFISADSLTILHSRLKDFSLMELSRLEVKQEDIFLAFAYDFNISDVKSKSDEEEKYIIDVFMVYHVLKGWGKLREKEYHSIEDLRNSKTGSKQMFHVLNYVFRRNYYVEDSSWTVTMLNHIRPKLDNQTEK